MAGELAVPHDHGKLAVVGTLEQLPLSTVDIAMFSIIFAATTYDSASYTPHLKAGDDPARWHRVCFAFALGPMPVALMLLQSDFRPIQVILLVISFPILLVGIALVRSLRADFEN